MASSIWKGHLTFGLISVPVRLVAAARGESISFNQLHKKDHSRIKQVIYCQAEDAPVPRSELVKGYEYEKDRYVVVEDEEIKKFQPQSARVMEIQEFVKVTDVDPVYMDASYYLQPDDAGEKPYTLLYEAMKRTGYVSIARLTMHNREHVVLVRPGPHGMILHTMYYKDEIRATDEFRTDQTLVKENELQLATMLVQQLAAEFQPEKYKDTYRENVKALIEAKIAGQEVVEPPAAQTMAPVIDIMEALKTSLTQLAKKPAGSEMVARGPAAVEPIAEAETPKRKKLARR
jgi:DNA end-binding protein Ku